MAGGIQMNMDHMKYLQEIADSDVRHIEHKEKTYQGSWKKRGGSGAFHMLARKMDRLENMCEKHEYDIFKAASGDLSYADGTILSEIRDLRTYLMLVEAELLAREDVNNIRPGTPEDGGYHARQIHYSDGLKKEDLPMIHCYMPVPMTDNLYIVDRNNTPKEYWEDTLPRLFLECNNKEYEMLQEYYKPLYYFNGSGDKWILKDQYHKNWAR
jgi:hypothetical protein